MTVKDLDFARHETLGQVTSARPIARVRSDRRVLKRIDEKPLQMALKRTMDIVVSSSALLVLLPVLLLIAVMIRMTSPGPALFSQLRWGKDCKKIKVYKFRSMYTDRGDQSGVVQTRVGDSRITPLGAILRKTNLDELPQLLNVLKGDMSLVGPRPHAIGMQAAGMLYEDLVPEYHKRHRVRPGITGLAQMRGLRGPTILASKSRARAAADLHYVDNYSLMLDISIIFGTLRNEAFGGSGF